MKLIMRVLGYYLSRFRGVLSFTFAYQHPLNSILLLSLLLRGGTLALSLTLFHVWVAFFFCFFIYASISSFALFFAFKRRCCCVLFFCAFFQQEFSSLFFSTSLSLRTDLEQVQAQWHACLFVVLRFGSSAPFRLFQLVVLGLSHCAASLRLPLPIFLCASLPSECLPKTARVFTSSLRYSGNLTSSDTPLINKK